MHGLRLGNNLSEWSVLVFLIQGVNWSLCLARTLYAADVADNVDANLYGRYVITGTYALV